MEEMEQLWIELGRARFEALKSGNWSPKTKREIAIWNEITSPENYSKLRKHIAERIESANPYAKEFFTMALTVAKGRYENSNNKDFLS